MTAPSTRGKWPVVDIVLVKDYQQLDQMKGAADCFLRIHMDIPIPEDEVAKLDEKLKKLDHRGVLDEVLNVATPSPGSRGLATLQAALGVIPPEPSHAGR
jgi:hypothetical protein